MRAESEVRFGVARSHILCRTAHPANPVETHFFSADNIILVALCGHQSYRLNGVLLRTNQQLAGMSDRGDQQKPNGFCTLLLKPSQFGPHTLYSEFASNIEHPEGS